MGRGRLCVSTPPWRVGSKNPRLFLFLFTINYQPSTLNLFPMDLADIQAFSARAAEVSLAPATILLGGTEYAANVPAPRVQEVLINGGAESTAVLSVRLSTTLHAGEPACFQDLRWKRPAEAEWTPLIWTIAEVKKSPIDAEWHLTCTPKN